MTLTNHRYRNYSSPVYYIQIKMRMIIIKIRSIDTEEITVAVVVEISIALIIVTQVTEIKREVHDMSTILIGNIDESTLSIVKKVCLENLT